MSTPVPPVPDTAPAAVRRGSALSVEGLGLQIGGATILKDVALDVAAGSLVGVIGPNGAGKTTLFNVISGLVKPTAGSVLLDGRDITTASVSSRARAGLGRTFQTSSLFPRLTVLENVRLAAQVALGGSASLVRFPRRSDAATELALAHIEAVGLSHLRESAAGDISHGDKRKLEIAVLLATDTSIVLLDEPMAGVGSGDVPGLVENIRALHREKGCTVLMVEHHIDVLMGLVDRVAVMYFGSIIAYDTPERIMADPLVQSAYLGSGAGAGKPGVWGGAPSGEAA
jgi:branched-chain amino acid transport system ATP-binding protein